MAIHIPSLAPPSGSPLQLMVVRGSQSVKRFGEQVRELQRPGADGADYRRAGKRADAFTVVFARDCSTPSEARQVEKWFKDLQGELVNYNDEHDHDWENVIVLRVETRNRLALFGTGYIKGAGDSRHLVEGTIVMQLTVESTSE